MPKKIYSPDWKEYQLIDAGEYKKLESWGGIVTIRPERQAYFPSGKPIKEWRDIAHLEFVPKGKKSGEWKHLRNFDQSNWNINYEGLTFQLETTKFKHVGLFPEQLTNWKFIAQHLQPQMKMLNLFAYTGAASIVGRSIGAEVTHVDSVKQLISWAKKNMERSMLKNIRWLHEDALKFAQRERKRGHFYDLIVMDPPAWGIGAKKEKWKLEHQLEGLIEVTSQLLHPGGILILNTYSPKINTDTLQVYAQKYFKEFEVAELWKKTTTKKDLFYGQLLRGKASMGY